MVPFRLMHYLGGSNHVTLFRSTNNQIVMGKGDRKSTKGKTWRGSYGKSRPKKKNVKKAVPAKTEAEA